LKTGSAKIFELVTATMRPVNCLLLSRRLAHFHDRGLDESQANHVAAHAAHRDAITNRKSRAAQDNEVARDRCDDLLQREREAGGHQPERRRQPCRVVEPDREQSADEHDGRDQADGLACPEPGLGDALVGASESQPDEPAQRRPDDQNNGDESQRQQ
jgi:hypothetical protein